MNKNLMNMDGMKRAAKKMLRGGGDLGSVVMDEKTLQGDVSGKLIPSINNVAMGLLKWSYAESNYTFPDVFSAWADLDVGFTQLLQEYLEECTRYRKSFKAIITEAKKVSDLQKEKERTASKVSTTSSKLEAAKKTAKKNENNEKAKVHVSSAEAELYQARAKDEETEELLRNTTADFECYKATMLKDSLITHCQSLQALLQKGTALCQVKMEIAESMPDEPAMTPDPGNDNNRKVEAIFNKYHLQLPQRDPTVERNLPAQRFKTLPPPLSCYPPTSPRITKQTSLPVKTPPARYPRPLGDILDVESEEGEDDDDYMVPSEDITSRPTVKTIPPELPPRNVAEEEDYVVPTLSPKSPMGNKVQPPSSPGDMEADYFQVISDDEKDGNFLSTPRKPSNPRRRQDDRNAPEPVSEPVYTVPPDENEDNTDSGQLYGNMSNEELEEHNRTSVCIPVKPTPYGKPKKPAVYPKPALKQTKEAPSRRRQDSASKDEECAAEDDDIYSMVCEEENAPNKTGVSPRTPSQRHVFLDSDQPGHDRQTRHTYFNAELSHQDSFDSAGESDNTDVSHTYFNVRIGDKDDKGDKEMNGSDPTLYGNVPPVPDQTALTSNSKPTPPVAKKPAILPRKTLHPVQGGVK